MKNRFIITKCAKTENNYIPFWDLSFKEEDDDIFYLLKDGSRFYYDLIDCYYDTLEHKIVFGYTKDIYPTNLNFNKGEKVYYEIDNLYFKESSIVDIIYESYDSHIIDYNLISSYKKYFTDIEYFNIKIDDIIELKFWNPTFIFEDNYKTTNTYAIKKIYK